LVGHVEGVVGHALSWWAVWLALVGARDRRSSREFGSLVPLRSGVDGRVSEWRSPRPEAPCRRPRWSRRVAV